MNTSSLNQNQTIRKAQPRDISDAGLSKRATIAWRILCDHANKDNMAWPKIRTIARESAYGRRSIQYGITELIGRGWVCAPFGAAGGRKAETQDRGNATTYHLHPDGKPCALHPCESTQRTHYLHPLHPNERVQNTTLKGAICAGKGAKYDIAYKEGTSLENFSIRTSLTNANARAGDGATISFAYPVFEVPEDLRWINEPYFDYGAALQSFIARYCDYTYDGWPEDEREDMGPLEYAFVEAVHGIENGSKEAQDFWPKWNSVHRCHTVEILAAKSRYLKILADLEKWAGSEEWDLLGIPSPDEYLENVNVYADAKPKSADEILEVEPFNYEGRFRRFLRFLDLPEYPADLHSPDGIFRMFKMALHEVSADGRKAFLEWGPDHFLKPQVIAQAGNNFEDLLTFVSDRKPASQAPHDIVDWLDFFVERQILFDLCAERSEPSQMSRKPSVSAVSVPQQIAQATYA